MTAWYVSRPVRLSRRTFVVVEGTDPWNRHALDLGFVGEHARWWLELQVRHQRWPWWQVKMPPYITTIRSIHLGPYDRAIAWLVTLYAIRCTLRCRRGW